MMRAAILLAAALAPATARTPAPSAEAARARVLAALQRLALSPAPPAALAEEDDGPRQALLGAFRTMIRDLPPVRRPGAPPPAQPLPAEPGLVRRLADLSPAPLRPGTSARMPTGPYRLPASGRVITGMGERMASGWRARGLILAPPPDASVIAPAAGRIAYAGSFGGYGRIVILDHGHGWTTLLAGLARVKVRRGSRIDQGAGLGIMPHDDPRLTIELRHRGRPVDVTAMALS